MAQQHTLPSGLTVGLSSWKLKHRAIVKDINLVRKGLMLHRMLDAAMSELVSPGPYAFTDRVDWNKVAWVDIASALIHARTLTPGKEVVELTQPCQYCKSPIPVNVDLTQIKTRPISPEGLASLRAKQPMTVLVSERSGKFYKTPEEAKEVGLDPNSLVKVSINILMGSDVPRMVKIKGEHRDADDSLVQRAMQISTISAGGKDYQGLDKVMAYLGDCEITVELALRAFMEEVEGGPDTLVSISCSECKAENTFGLPFGAEFFMI